ncbi:tricarboxylate binding receptor domain protein [Bordetella holmesii 30539]|nr:tricarboxylate binding receptor domain protein [Bordetella holmesii 30539]
MVRFLRSQGHAQSVGREDLGGHARSHDGSRRQREDDCRGQRIHASTPEQFAAFVDKEIAKWAEAVKISGARVD